MKQRPRCPECGGVLPRGKNRKRGHPACRALAKVRGGEPVGILVGDVIYNMTRLGKGTLVYRDRKGRLRLTP